MDKVKLQEAVDYFKELPSRSFAEQMNDAEFIRNFAELILVANDVLNGKLVELMSEDDLGISMLETYRGCGHQTAVGLWTGKHYQFEQKSMFAKLAHALAGHVEKQEVAHSALPTTFCPCGLPLDANYNRHYDGKVKGFCNKKCLDRF